MHVCSAMLGVLGQGYSPKLTFLSFQNTDKLCSVSQCLVAETADFLLSRAEKTNLEIAVYFASLSETSDCMISVNPDSCLSFFHLQKNAKFLGLRYLVFFYEQ